MLRSLFRGFTSDGMELEFGLYRMNFVGIFVLLIQNTTLHVLCAAWKSDQYLRHWVSLRIISEFENSYAYI